MHRVRTWPAVAVLVLGLILLLDQPSGAQAPPQGQSATSTTTEPPVANATAGSVGFSSSALGALLALAGTVFVAAQVFDGRRQRRLFELQVQRELSGQWVSHRDGWVLATLAVRGTADYYALGGGELHRIYGDWHQAREAAYGSGCFDDNLHQTHRQLERQIEEPIRAMLCFLDDVVGHVLDSTIRVEVAFDIVGRDVVRSSSVLRELVGRRFAQGDVAGGDQHNDACLSPDRPHELANWLSYYPGLRIRLLLLLDLLWAEGCRRGELSSADTAFIASLKRETGSGARNRRRAASVARAARGRIRGALLAVRLQWLLVWGEHPNCPVEEEDLYQTRSAPGVAVGRGPRQWAHRARTVAFRR